MIQHSTLFKRLNKYLADQGLLSNGKPVLRIVWADDEREPRFGRYDDYHGKIYLRTFIGVRDVPKYPYCKGMWVLEKWTPPRAEILRELPLAVNGTYEPLYVFMDGDGKPLPLNEEIVKHIVYILHNPILPGDRESRLRTEDERKQQKDRETDLDIMEDANPYLVGKLHGQEAIVRP